MSQEHDKKEKKEGGHGHGEGHGGAAPGGGHGGGGGHEEAHEGAPEWLISFADNVTLMMGFFVILLALNLKPSSGGGAGDEGGGSATPAVDDIDWAIAVREAFNNPVDMNSSKPGEQNMVQRIRDYRRGGGPLNFSRLAKGLDDLGYSDTPGIDGSYSRVTKVRDGLEVTVGGPIAFGRFSADIEPGADKVLEKLTAQLVGKSNKLEIRGHATDEPLPVGAVFRDPMDLSMARARQVRDRLVELGLDPRTIRVSGAGQYEPLEKEAFDESHRAANRRVEITVSRALVSDYAGT